MYFLYMIRYIFWQLYSGAAMSEDGAILLWFESWFRWSLASCLWTSYLISPSLSSFTGEMKIFMVYKTG